MRKAVIFLATLFYCSNGVTENEIVFPLISSKVTSKFGARAHPIRQIRAHHDGVDIAAPLGTEVRAISGGHVVFANQYGSYGKLVVIKHNEIFTSHYGHLGKILVVIGQTIFPGEVIGEIGKTGAVTGPHLHFEIRDKGTAVNPEDLIGGIGVEAQG